MESPDPPSWNICLLARCEKGPVRAENQDRVWAQPVGEKSAAPLEQSHSHSTAGQGCLVMVADGLGGAPKGELASQMAIDHLIQGLSDKLAGDPWAYPKCADQTRLLDELAASAHQAVIAHMDAHPADEGLGTTLTALWLRDTTGVLLQIGDSRAYRWTGRQLEALTVDQSAVGRLQQSGKISVEEARQHPFRHLVEQVIGGQCRPLEPDLKDFPTREGELYLLCTDGLTESLNDEQIAYVLASRQHRPLAEIADALYQDALQVGGQDNISFVLVRIGEKRPPAWSTWPFRMSQKKPGYAAKSKRS